MLQLGGGLDLGEEALGAQSRAEIGMQDFEGNIAVVLEVVAKKHRGHTAGADFAVHGVAAGEGGIELVERVQPRDLGGRWATGESAVRTASPPTRASTPPIPYVLSMRPPHTRWSRGLLLLASLGVAVAIAPRPLAAQSRALHWPAITVQAHLDADGRLRVREEQQIRFVGDWNGGERSFNVPFQQKLSLLSLSRVDAVTGQPVLMTKGNLDIVDGFDWSDDGSTLRWRSRLASDPPFDGQVLTYVIEMEYENILVKDGAVYRLNHDFSFADRNGPIDRFALTLTFDEAWRVPEGTSTTYEQNAMEPGCGYVVTLPLTYVGAGLPAGVFVGASSSLRQGLAVALVAAILAMFAALYRRERALGRFAPVPGRASITPQFIEEHILAHPPEVIGAMWDDRTAAPEVAATLARMVYDKQLTSRVERTKVLFVSRDVLHLGLTVSRAKLAPHELALVDALFESGQDATSTDAVRARYKSSGFDPAALIKPMLNAMALQHAPKLDKGSHPSYKPTLAIFTAALVTSIIALVLRGADIVVVGPAFGAMLPLYIFGVVWASVWRNRVANFAMSSLGILIPVALIAAIAVTMLLLPQLSATAVAFLAATLWALTFVNSITMAARTHDTPERMIVRKRLWAIRDFFARELHQEQPRLIDAWFPYVIAFGLGREADKWFKAFGAVTAASALSATAFGGSSGSNSSSGSRGSGWSGFGGGGGFSGAGSGGSFAAAVGGMAAAVPSPSSSSSGGGGGGGGGSSGGGGGGGW